jgi:hypothetical protein
MVKTKKYITKKNTTKKNKDKGLTYYASNFKGTELIPRTSIINYMLNNYNRFLQVKRESVISNKETISLDECFNIGDIFNVINTKGGKVSLNSTIDGNKIFGLDKMIAYAFYSKSKDLFERNNVREFAKLLKYQMGKDIHRDNRTINGEDYGMEYFSRYSEDYYSCTDVFYEIIIGYLNKISRFIDYNLANKIALLSCQSMYNFIIDLISHKIMEKMTPEVVNITQSEKNQIITLTNSKKEMEFNFKSKAYITYNGEIMDITNPCGNLEFTLLFDFKNNDYKFTKFIFEYDYDICKSPEQEEFIIETHDKQNSTLSDVDISQQEKNKDNKIIYGISAGLGAAGIASLPFILGALGGNKINKKYKNKIKNKRKTKKKNIIYNY